MPPGVLYAAIYRGEIQLNFLFQQFSNRDGKHLFMQKNTLNILNLKLTLVKGGISQMNQK